MTVPQQESCVKLLRALREAGQLENLLEMATRVPMPSSSSGGSMHDGSKRRLVEVSSVSSFEFLEELDPEEFLPMPSLQMPLKIHGLRRHRLTKRTSEKTQTSEKTESETIRLKRQRLKRQSLKRQSLKRQKSEKTTSEKTESEKIESKHTRSSKLIEKIAGMCSIFGLKLLCR